ncbi:MAG: hypothetical protein OXC40_04745 [Proteobacteria bacterium]|nr:hypothetical protein [Pseudomonadota bacterium]
MNSITKNNFSVTECMIYVGITLGFTFLVVGCEDPINNEKSNSTTMIYQKESNQKAINLDKESAPIPLGNSTLERESRIESHVNDGSHGIDLVMVVDNSNSMVKYGNESKTHDYFGRTLNNPHHAYFGTQTSAHKLNKAFDVFAKQIKEKNIDLNVTLVTAAANSYSVNGYARNHSYDETQKNETHFFYLPARSAYREAPQTCIHAMNILYPHPQSNDFRNGSYTFIYADGSSNPRYSRDVAIYDPSEFDRPGNIYSNELIDDDGYFPSKFGGNNSHRYRHINCVVESFASLWILANLINPNEELQVEANRQKVFRNKNTLKIFVVISDSFSPGPDDIAEPTRGVLKTIVERDLIEDTETKFEEQANKAFGRENVRFYSFSTEGNAEAKKFADDDETFERVRQTHLNKNNRLESSRSMARQHEPTSCGRYFGRSYTHLAKYYDGGLFKICSTEWTTHFETIFSRVSPSGPVDTNSYELESITGEGKTLEVTGVRIGDRTIEATDYTIDKTTDPYKITFKAGVLDKKKVEKIYINVSVK